MPLLTHRLANRDGELVKIGIKVWHICFDEVFASFEDGSQFDSSKWRDSRAEAFRMAESILKENMGSRHMADLLCEPPEMRQVHLILVDDNMYYTSMRRSFYKLAKKCKQDATNGRANLMII